jgi:hypothetical protein
MWEFAGIDMYGFKSPLSFNYAKRISSISGTNCFVIFYY